MIQKLTIELSDDERFHARLITDGILIASAQGHAGQVQAQGAIHALSGIIRRLGLLQEAPPSARQWQSDPLPGSWQAWDSERVDEAWGLRLPGGLIFGPLESPAAVHSVRTALYRMFLALMACPCRPFEVFLTDKDKWGFFDPAGLLHAGLDTRAAAQELADSKQRSREGGA